MEDALKAAAAFGSSLKTAMDDAGLSVMDLHKRTGISRATIYRLLRGEALRNRRFCTVLPRRPRYATNRVMVFYAATWSRRCFGDSTAAVRRCA